MFNYPNLLPVLKQSLQVASTFMATTLALAVTAQNAKALDFTFSFDNVNGNVAGTVSGTIIGLEDNTSSPADSIIIENFPAGLAGDFDNGQDVVAWDTIFINNFTVTNGIITSAEFEASEVNDVFDNPIAEFDQFTLNRDFDIPTVGSNYLSLDGFSTNVRNDLGFGGISFAPATPVPFGVIPDTGLGILAGIWVVSRLRKTI